MSTHLLETGIEDYGLAVVRHVAEHLDGDKKESALARSPGSELLAKATACRDDHEAFTSLLLPHTSLLFQKCEPQDTEACVNVLCHLISCVQPPAAASAIALQFCDTLASEHGHRELQRVSTMLELFNTTTLPAIKFAIIKKVLAYAQTGNISSLAPSLQNKAEAWTVEWDLNPEEASSLFSAVAAVLDSHPHVVPKLEAFTLRSKVLLSCPADDPAAVAALKPVAYAAALSFIANSQLFVCDMFAAAPVQALKGDAKYRAAYELLSIMLKGDMASYKAGSFDGVFKAAGLQPEACLEKMRMMSLVALCCKNEGAEVPFAEVNAALMLKGDDAEAWLVRAFGKMLVDGRIDQVQETVKVRRCEHRVFGNPEWKRLQSDLNTWRENLKGIEVMMKEQTLLTPTSTVQRWLSS